MYPSGTKEEQCWVRFRNKESPFMTMATATDYPVQGSAYWVELDWPLNKQVNSSLCNSGGAASGFCGLNPAAGLYSPQLKNRIGTGQARVTKGTSLKCYEFEVSGSCKIKSPFGKYWKTSPMPQQTLKTLVHAECEQLTEFNAGSQCCHFHILPYSPKKIQAAPVQNIYSKCTAVFASVVLCLLGCLWWNTRSESLQWVLPALWA